MFIEGDSLKFTDLVYGEIVLDDWIEPFIRIPEFARLRGVRLSNVDSIEFKDFGSANRWEHGIAVAYLASLCAEEKGLPLEERVKLVLAALLHDVATPPFAHTAEYVLPGFNHEVETYSVLSNIMTDDSNTSLPVLGSLLPQFANECRKLSKGLGVKVEPKEVASLIVGDGPLGFLVSGTIDLDNIDNVIRGCTLMGINVSKGLSVRLVKWLSNQKSTPLELSKSENLDVLEWLDLRKSYYSKFFFSSEAELGRQAFLQHLFRVAIEHGVARRNIVWNTDEGFLAALERIEVSDRAELPIRELVTRYRLMEPVYELASVDINDIEILRTFKSPEATNWLERHLRCEGFNPFVMLSLSRGAASKENTLLPEALGKLLIFKLGAGFDWKMLPDFLKDSINKKKSGVSLTMELSEQIHRNLKEWSDSKPWLSTGDDVTFNVKNSLDSVGDWSFRLNRNETLHAYPGTYVHALPAALIHALGLKGARILDLFGGTGQTAVEAIKAGGYGYSFDSNYIASMVAETKLSYLGADARRSIRALSTGDIKRCSGIEPPDFSLRDKWHNRESLDELCQIMSFINSRRDPVKKLFMKTAFSAVLTSTTGRKGKQHGFFADNTPLPRGQELPEYQPAIELFLAKLKKNVDIIEKFYAFFERQQLCPQVELSRAHVVQSSACDQSLSGLGVRKSSIDGIITSPPYLCMADYTLGNRLSYYWLAPEEMNKNFNIEIGARRTRTNPLKAEALYFDNMTSFFTKSSLLLKRGGYLALVIGEPQANAFADKNVLERLDIIADSLGFKLIWERWRPILWHRNQGYQRLRQERIVVFKYCP